MGPLGNEKVIVPMYGLREKSEVFEGVKEKDRGMISQIVLPCMLSYLRCDGGYVLSFVLICFFVLLGFVGLVTDIQRIIYVRSLSGQVADGASLAILKEFSETTTYDTANMDDDTIEALEAFAMHYSTAHNLGDYFTSDGYEISVSAVGGDSTTIQVCISGDVFLLLVALPLKMFGGEDVGTAGISICGQSTTRISNVEVALVYDLSTSMSNRAASGDRRTKVEALEEVTKSFFAGFPDSMWQAADQDGVPILRVGMVPFAGAVSLATRGASADGSAHWIESGNVRWDWIDMAGRSSYNSSRHLPLSGGASRMSIYEDMGIGWNGCIEARPSPLDVQDTPPSSTNPDTLWVPFLAPDEPDVNNIASTNMNTNNFWYRDMGTISCSSGVRNIFANSYLYDGDGTMPNAWCPDFSNRIPMADLSDRFSGSLTKYNRANMEAMRRAYVRARPHVDRIETWIGGFYRQEGSPFKHCDIPPIVGLTNDKAYLEGLVDDFSENLSQGTVIPAGLAWGWRILSPGVPFTEGRSYDAPDSQKILILMSDGDNFVQAQTNTQFIRGAELALTPYFYYGYAFEDDRIGGTEALDSALSYRNRNRAVINDLRGRMQDLCEGIRQAGITIYTIGFGRNFNDRTLRRCVGGNRDNFFTARNAAELRETFEEISRLMREKIYINK